MPTQVNWRFRQTGFSFGSRLDLALGNDLTRHPEGRLGPSGLEHLISAVPLRRPRDGASVLGG
jgi:hypothetical protein